MPTVAGQTPNLFLTGPLLPVQVLVSAAAEQAYAAAGTPLPTAEPALALIDTGATRTVIQATIPQKLGLEPVGSSLVHSASNANVPCDEYLVRLMLLPGVFFEVPALALPLQGQQIQILIGRDMLAHCVLVYTGLTNSFSLSI